MSRNRFLPILLSAALVAQSVIAGWGHVHVADGLHSHFGIATHSHHHHLTDGHGQHHTGDANEHQPTPDRSTPDRPTHSDDCSVCRHLALVALLTLDLEAISTGDAVELLQDGESTPVSTFIVGLRRPRSPPELG